MAKKAAPPGVSDQSGGTAAHDTGAVTSEYSTINQAQQEAGCATDTLLVTIAEFHNKADNLPKTRVLTWAQLVNALGTHQERSQKDGGLFSPVIYRPKTKRANSNVEALTLAVGEWDGGESYAEVAERLKAAGYAFAAYSTYSNAPENEHFRVVLPLAQEVKASDWRRGARVWARISEHVFGGTNEPHDGDEARMYYWPTCPPDALRFVDRADGRALDAYNLPEVPAEATPGSNGHHHAAPGELSGLPIGSRAAKFVAFGAPKGQQRTEALATARNLREAGWSVDSITDKLCQGFQACEQDAADPWTREHAQAIAENIDSKPAPPPKPLANATGPTPTVAPADPAAADDADGMQRDYGHAAILSRLFKNRYRWAVHRSVWMEYCNGVWRSVPEESVAKNAADALRREYSTQLAVATNKESIRTLANKVSDSCVYARVTGALAFLRGWDGFLTQLEDGERTPWDRDGWLLNMRNGTFNLSTGELQPHCADDLLTKQVAAAYEPTAVAPAWTQHLEMFLPNPNIRRQIQRNLGCALCGETLEESLALWHGGGANGKTTTARALLRLLSGYANRAAPNLLVESKHERHPTEIADLCAKRLVFSIEIDQGKHLAEALAKDLTGGDPTKARYMREDFFTFEQTYTIVLIVNHKPVIIGNDDGIWRRIRVVPWEHKITVGEKRPQSEVLAELATEASGIMNWLLAGWQDWQQDHNWAAPEVQAASELYRAEMDVLGDFIRDCCIFGTRYEVPKADLYEAYASWCTANREKPLGKTTFGSLLQGRGIGGRRGAKGVRLHVGIALLAGVTNGDTVSGCPPGESNLINNAETVSPNVTQTPLLPGPKYEIGAWVNAVSEDGVLQTIKPVQILDVYESANGAYFYALPDTKAGWPEACLEPAEPPADEVFDRLQASLAAGQTGGGD